MKEGVESLGRVRAQAIVLLVFAFLAGAFVGGTMERVMGRGPRTNPPRSSFGGFGFACPTGDRQARQAPAGLPPWYEPLNLTVEQRTKIEEISKKRSARVDSAMTSACAVMGPARDSSFKEIDAVLTAEQRAKRDSLRAVRASGARGTGGRRGGGFGRGETPRP